MAFILIPILDQLTPQSNSQLTEKQEQTLQNSSIHSILLFAMLPIQWGLLFLLCWKTSVMDLHSLDSNWMGLVVSMGICCGIFGINVAHELGHRNDRWATLTAKGLLLSSLYMHFIIEHNLGHHKNVATTDDPASAGKGEWVYIFWIKSVTGSWQAAWNLETNRTIKKKLQWWHNEMVWFSMMQISLLIVISITFGWVSLLSFLSSAIIGILLLETINYIEHYGLRREIRTSGRYERVLPQHSWNCNRSVGRLLLFELTRHSDHHAHVKRPYQILRHFDTAPEFPAGYPAMIVLSLFPPLWFSVMDKRLETHLQLMV